VGLLVEFDLVLGHVGQLPDVLLQLGLPPIAVQYNPFEIAFEVVQILVFVLLLRGQLEPTDPQNFEVAYNSLEIEVVGLTLRGGLP